MKSYKMRIGKRFGRLTVLREIPCSERNTPRRLVLVRCDCGIEKLMNLNNAKASVSCGCWKRERMSKLTPQRKALGEYVGGKITHGMSRTVEFRTWRSMRNRCYRPSDISFKHYGAKGVKVCKRWRNSFENFFQDMGHRPQGRFTLERRNRDKDYTPKNCYWATYIEQANNRSNNRMITIDGVTLTVAQWCRKYNIPVATAWHRMHRGWPELLAMTQPVNPYHFSQ